MNNENYIEILIARVLSGEADRNEIAELEKWKNLSNENTAHYNSLKKIFSLSASQKPHIDFDTDAAWIKVKSSISKEKGKIISLPQIILRVAAILLLVAGISYTAYKIILPEEIIPVTLASGENAQEFVQIGRAHV